MLKSRLFAEWAALLAAMIALVVFAQDRGWTNRLDLLLLDGEGQVNTPELHPSIIVIEIDDMALDAIGAWPWSRDVHARLIDAISASGPRAIALDVLFIEPGDQRGDAALAGALARSGKVILPHSFAPRLNSRDGEVPVYPLPALRESAAAMGHAVIVPDKDGVARSFELVRKRDAKSYPQFALQTVNIAGVETKQSVAGSQAAIIRYGPTKSLPSLSASSVLAGHSPTELFENAIVLIGATSPGLGDRYSVPSYAGRMLTGVETQAHLVNAILTDNLVHTAPAQTVAAIQIAAIVLLFIGFWRLPPHLALWLAIVLFAGLIAVSFASLMLFNVWVQVGGALLAIIISYPLWGWRRLLSVSRFLQSEAALLKKVADNPQVKSNDGFDLVARQVAQVKRLTSDVSNSLTLVQDIIGASPDAIVVTDGMGRIIMGNAASEALFGRLIDNEGLTFPELLLSTGGALDEAGEEITFPDGRAFWLATAKLDPAVGSEVLSLREVTDARRTERQRRETLEFLSHDMRTPQVAIIGLASQADNSASAADRFERIERQARRTLKLTDDFVQIARLESDGIDREEAEFNSIVREAMDRAFSMARAKRIELIFAEQEDTVFAWVDPFAISRVLDNLLSNAIKFSPAGSRVEIGLTHEREDHLALSVSDEGPGLPLGRQERPFERFGGRDTAAGPSSGLGLAYVKEVVDLHDGAIMIETTPEQGTRLTITLPTQLAQ